MPTPLVGTDDNTRPPTATLTCTVDEAADHLRVSRAQIYNLIAAKTLRSFTIGRSRRIPRSELERFVNEACV